MMRRFQFISILIGLALSLVLPGQAARIPVGTVAVIERLGDESSDTHFDLYSSILMPGMSKTIAQQGLSQGFFIVESKDGAVSGFDLRPIMLYHIGLVKTPIKMMAPRRSKSSEGNPVISLPSLQEPAAQTPAASPLPLLSPKINVSETDSKVAAGSGNEDAKQDLNVDLKRLQTYFLKTGDGPQISLLPAVINSPDVSSRTVMPTDSRSYKFRFFTYRMVTPATAGYLNIVEKNSERYDGSFLVASPLAIRSVSQNDKGYGFFVRQGRILLGGFQQSVEVTADQVKINIPPQAIVAIEADEKKGVAVLALDCPDNASVSLAVPAGTPADLKLRRFETVELPGESANNSSAAHVIKMTAKSALERSWVYRVPQVPQAPVLARLLDDLRKQILSRSEGKAQSLP